MNGDPEAVEGSKLVGAARAFGRELVVEKLADQFVRIVERPQGDVGTWGSRRQNSSAEPLLQFLDCKCWLAAMQHGVAVRADGPQVLDRVHLVFSAKLRQLPNVVNMDKSFANVSVTASKIQVAHLTSNTVMLDANSPRSPVAFECVYDDNLFRSFPQLSAAVNFFCQQQIGFIKMTEHFHRFDQLGPQLPHEAAPAVLSARQDMPELRGSIQAHRHAQIQKLRDTFSKPAETPVDDDLVLRAKEGTQLRRSCGTVTAIVVGSQQVDVPFSQDSLLR